MHCYAFPGIRTAFHECNLEALLEPDPSPELTPGDQRCRLYSPRGATLPGPSPWAVFQGSVRSQQAFPRVVSSAQFGVGGATDRESEVGPESAPRWSGDVRWGEEGWGAGLIFKLNGVMFVCYNFAGIERGWRWVGGGAGRGERGGPERTANRQNNQHIEAVIKSRQNVDRISSFHQFSLSV